MLIFDIRHNAGDTYTATIWEEGKKNNITYSMPQNTLDKIAMYLVNRYPDQFPSIEETTREVNAVHYLNITNGKNSFGIEYPYQDRTYDNYDWFC